MLHLLSYFLLEYPITQYRSFVKLAAWRLQLAACCWEPERWVDLNTHSPACCLSSYLEPTNRLRDFQESTIAPPSRENVAALTNPRSIPLHTSVRIKRPGTNRDGVILQHPVKTMQGAWCDTGPAKWQFEFMMSSTAKRTLLYIVLDNPIVKC